MSTSPPFVYPPMFHLRDGFYFARDGGDVLVGHGLHTIRVPVNEWASAVAVTTARGENAETFNEAVALLTKEPPASLRQRYREWGIARRGEDPLR